MRTTAAFKHSAQALLEALLLAAIVGGLLAAVGAAQSGDLPGLGTARAARSAGHISVPDGPFAGTTTATVNPGGDVWVSAKCYQAGVLVWGQMVRVNADNQAVLALGPSQMWTSGSAACTAAEGYFDRQLRWRVLATTTFNAYD